MTSKLPSGPRSEKRDHPSPRAKAAWRSAFRGYPRRGCICDDPREGKYIRPDQIKALDKMQQQFSIRLNEMSDYETRFGGIARLYGQAALQKLRSAHVCVVGIGGVGTWSAEALARSGVGALTLVDLDEVCVSNINRQLHALTDTIGRAKVEVMAERIRAINPDCRVVADQRFFNEHTAAALLEPRYDFVLDAIDSVTNKVLLLAGCRQRNLPVVACGGAGGRRDGTQVRVADLAKASHDRLLAEVRKRLRKEFQFPADGSPMSVECVFSAEAPVFPQPDGSVCENRAANPDGTRLNCNGGLGSATFVTGAFGFAAAGIVVDRVAAKQVAPLLAKSP